MADSLLTLPARLTVRTVRSLLTLTRDLAEQGLGVVDLLAQIVETPVAPPPPPTEGAPIDEVMVEAEVVELFDDDPAGPA